MNQDNRIPFGMPMNFPIQNEQFLLFLSNNQNIFQMTKAAPIQSSNFRKRRSEDMDNPEFRPKSISVPTLPTPVTFQDKQSFSSHTPLLPCNSALDSNVPWPAHVNCSVAGQLSQPRMITNGQAPNLFYDQTFWKRFQESSASDTYQSRNDQFRQIESDFSRTTVQKQRMLLSPLPSLNWADRCELWESMLRKDVAYTRSSNCLTRHPSLHPRMRAILLSWLSEVCEAYKLHRETYYLAIDFLDRFLVSSKQEIAKNNLQLVGITTLFIAAKIEEIYPPKIREFAYVCDGACLVEEIKRMELIILGALEWQLCPMTAIGWLSTFLQVAYLSDMSGRELSSTDVVLPKYSRDFFTSMAQILDLCVLDIENLRFPYSHLAASAVFHLSNANIAYCGSGISIEVLKPCIEWMRPFVDVLFERGFSETHHFEGVMTDEQYTIQSHLVDFELLQRAQKKVEDDKKRIQQQRQPQREQRELFSGLQPALWHSFADSPLRLSNQQMPLTPLCTPPDDGHGDDSRSSGLIMKPIYMANENMQIDDRSRTTFKSED